MGYESVVSREAETAPSIGLGVHATYMQRVVLLPRIPNPARPLPFGRVRGHQGDRVWVEWMDHEDRKPRRRLVSAARAQFLAPACAICRARFTHPGERHRHEVDGYPRTLTPRGVADDPYGRGGPVPRPSNAGPSAILGITTPHDGPSVLTINPPINSQTAGWDEAANQVMRPRMSGDDLLRSLARSRGLLR